MIKIQNKKKIALVLSGGGVKAAAFHIGVCLALQEKGFKFIGGTREKVEESADSSHPLAIKTYVGSSAGALVSAFLASGYSIEDIIESFASGSGLIRGPVEKAKLRSLNYLDIFSLNAPTVSGLLSLIFKRKSSLLRGGLEVLLKNNFKVNGLFTTKRLENYLREHVLPTNSFNELGVDFYAVATLLDHSRKAVFGPQGNLVKSPETNFVSHVGISDAVAASVSLPPVYAPYPIPDQDGQLVYYFDGEIRDTLSTHVASDGGADLIISSYSIQPYHLTQEMGSLSQFGLPLILNQALYQVIEQKIIKTIQAREDLKNAVGLVEKYFEENNLPAEHAAKLVDRICTKVGLRRETDYIYIHPQGHDYEMFFADHFSLKPEILTRIFRTGFRTALHTLRKYNFHS